MVEVNRIDRANRRPKTIVNWGHSVIAKVAHYYIGSYLSRLCFPLVMETSGNLLRYLRISQALQRGH